MHEQDLTAELQQRVRQAIADNHALRIVGGDSKAFYGGHCLAEEKLETSGHRGVVAYEPSESVITARAGSKLTNIAEVLAGQRQMLGFEPPDFAGQATLGGSLACGFSGPRRPFAGSARDFMLGCKIINGHGEVLNFGGRVMKNVAGFDVSRLMVGALGSLGVILEVSLRVMPVPETELTLTYQMTEQQALVRMSALSGQPWPLSAMAYDGDRLWLRLSGAGAAVRTAARQLGGDMVDGAVFWQDLREQQLPFFQMPGGLWRISVAPATAPLKLSGHWLLDWSGALRWLKTDMPAEAVHSAAQQAGGYAVCFRGGDKSNWFRLAAGMQALQQNIRAAFDPLSIFNPGRLWP